MMDYDTIILLLVSLAACAFALVRGGGAERLAAGIVLASVPVGFAVTQMPTAQRPVAELTADGVVAFLILALALRFTTRWLGVMLLLYALQFALHAFYFVTDRTPDPPYLLANNLIFLTGSVTLLVGTAATVRQRAAPGGATS